MATKRFDELTAATALTGDDLLPIMDGAATTKKITAANARDYFAAASDPAGTAAAAVVAHAGAADPHADRAYTDAQIAAFLSTAFDFKASVRAATTADITLSGAQTIDGVAVVAGDRVLVKNQATGSQNGLYVAAAGAWTRSTDADANAEVTAGLSVPVEEGTVNGGRVFLLTTANPIVVGTTALSFSLVDAGDLRAANNLSDLTSASSARTNLGLGSSATTASTAYATAAQGATADAAVPATRTISTTTPLAGGGALSGNLTLTVGAASDAASGVVELATTAEVVTGTDTARAVTPAGFAAGLAKQPEFMIIAVGDETTAITTGTAKVTWRMPFAFTVTAVRASLATASSSGNPAIDINEGGASIFSTTLTIDANELTSTTAATACVISDAAIADDALMTIDIDTAGTGAKGLKVCIYGTRA